MAANGDRTERKIMVTYDLWSYMTITIWVLDVIWDILHAYGWWMLILLMRACNMLRSSPRIPYALREGGFSFQGQLTWKA